MADLTDLRMKKEHAAHAGTARESRRLGQQGHGPGPDAPARVRRPPPAKKT